MNRPGLGWRCSKPGDHWPKLVDDYLVRLRGKGAAMARHPPQVDLRLMRLKVRSTTVAVAVIDVTSLPGVGLSPQDAAHLGVARATADQADHVRGHARSDQAG